MGDNALTELGALLLARAADGVTVIRVLQRHGFGTVEQGQVLAVTSDGQTAGVLLRGALDATALDLALRAAIAPATQEAHIAEDDAVTAGLACAGGATLLGHPLHTSAASAMGEALAAGRPAALVSDTGGSAHMVLTGEGLATRTGSLQDTGSLAPGIDDAAVAAVAGMLRRGATTTQVLEIAAGDASVPVLVDLWVPVPSVLVVGGGTIGDALAAQAQVLGWAHQQVTTVAEAAAAIERFTDADVLVLLDHSPDFDDVLVSAARRGRGFLGLLGSRHTQDARRERLVAAGLTAGELGRFHGPVGLDLGSRTAAETAVSIVAQVIASRSGRGGAALAEASGRISA